MPQNRAVSIAYAALVSAGTVVTSLLLIIAYAIATEGELPREEDALGPALIWIFSWIPSLAGLVAVFALREVWISRQPIWLQAGLIPVLILGIGIVATVIGFAGFVALMTVF